jgi:hypothetical protein
MRGLATHCAADAAPQCARTCCKSDDTPIAMPPAFALLPALPACACCRGVFRIKSPFEKTKKTILFEDFSSSFYHSVDKSK